jgi:ABC-type multidrug transport system ATPase subunit
VNLSGGQKARVSLARACYSTSPLLLLDDPIAAVDVPTAKHLMDHVLAGLLKGRTVVLVTHNKTSLSYCDKVYLMEHGKLQKIAKDSLLDGELDATILDNPIDHHPTEHPGHAAEIGIVSDMKEPENLEIVDESTESLGQKGTILSGHVKGEKIVGGIKGSLTVKEDRVEGQVSWAAYTQYAKDGGG